MARYNPLAWQDQAYGNVAKEDGAFGASHAPNIKAVDNHIQSGPQQQAPGAVRAQAQIWHVSSHEKEAGAGAEAAGNLAWLQSQHTVQQQHHRVEALQQQQQQLAMQPSTPPLTGLMALLETSRAQQHGQLLHAPSQMQQLVTAPSLGPPVVAPPATAYGKLCTGSQMDLLLQPQQGLVDMPATPTGSAGRSSISSNSPEDATLPPATLQEGCNQQQQQHQQQHRSSEEAAAKLRVKVCKQLLQACCSSSLKSGSSSSSTSNVPCSSYSLQEGFSWVQGYAPDAAAVLLADKKLLEYLDYIEQNHSKEVLACVVFFVLGHHAAFQGVTSGVTLDTANKPAAVLNQRCSHYRAMFSMAPASKVQALAGLVAHRPDVASKLSGPDMLQLFQPFVDCDAVLTVFAGLAALPEGWQEAMPSVATSRAGTTTSGSGSKCFTRQWVSSFVKAVLQDAQNAPRMVSFINSRLKTADADAATTAAGGTGGVGAALTASTSSAVGASVACSEAFGAGSRAPAEAGSSSGVWKQPLPPAAATAISVGSFNSRNGTNPVAVSRTSSICSSTNDPAAAAPPGGSNHNAACVSEAVKLALVQLIHDRPDVAQYATKELRNRIKALPMKVALEAVGALAELPQGWNQGLTEPKAELNKVVARTAAMAGLPAGVSSTASSCWSSHKTGTAACGCSSSSTAGPATAGVAAAAGAGAGVVTAGSKATSIEYEKLQRERPDVAAALTPGIKGMLRELKSAQRSQVLKILAQLPPKLLALKGAEEVVQKHLSAFCSIMAAGDKLRPQAQEMLLQLHAKHPDAMMHVDAGLVNRIAALPTKEQQVVACTALFNADYRPGWDKNVRNGSCWLMGAVTNALKELR